MHVHLYHEYGLWVSLSVPLSAIHFSLRCLVTNFVQTRIGHDLVWVN